MINNMHAVQIILASQSPRRRQLLDQIGIIYSPINADINESIHRDENASEYAARMARNKARAVFNEPDIPVLAADTVVVIGGRILGKPASRKEAAEMLRQLVDELLRDSSRDGT